MIARLRGVLAERGADHVVVDCGGVGYRAAVSLATLAALPDVGAEVTLRVFTHVQETRIALYGFATAEERELFDALITVKNVGPATALEVLSGVAAPRELARAIAGRDTGALTRVRGVGRKRAELLVVELCERCEKLLAAWGEPSGERRPCAPAPGEERSPLLDDVVSALVNMGMRGPAAQRLIAQLEVPADATFDSLLRTALQAARQAQR